MVLLVLLVSLASAGERSLEAPRLPSAVEPAATRSAADAAAAQTPSLPAAATVDAAAARAAADPAASASSTALGEGAMAAARSIAAALAPQAEEAALADALEIDVPFLVDAERGLTLDEGGALRLDRHGFPEPDDYFAAAKAARLLADAAVAAALGARERAALERLKAAYESTRALLFSGKNRLAVTEEYVEPTPGGARMTVLDFVRAERFKMPGRWVWSSQHSRGAPRGYASVTASTARSPFLKDLGAGAFTTIYWAALPGDEFGRPDPDGMRLRVNSDAEGHELTLEVLVPLGRETDGQPRWTAFFFKKLGGEWVPGSREKMEPSERCIACHVRVGEDGQRRLTPMPTILKTKADFLAVGYKDTALLDRYLRDIASY